MTSRRRLSRIRIGLMCSLLAAVVVLTVAVVNGLPGGPSSAGLRFLLGAALTPVLFSPWEWAIHRYLYHRVFHPALLGMFLVHHRDHHHTFFPPHRFENPEARDGSPQAHPSVFRVVAHRLTGRDLAIPDRWVYFLLLFSLVGGAAWMATASVPFCAGILTGALTIVSLFGKVHGTIHRPGRHPRVEAQSWFGFLRRHHFIHHVDTEANANFLVPLADWMFGTLRLRLREEEAIPAASVRLAPAAITAAPRLHGAGLLFLALASAAAAGGAQRIEVAPGEALSVEDLGSGPVVVVIPGLTVPGYGFRAIVPGLLARGHRVLVVEPLGIGKSSRPARADYSLTAHADRLGVLLDALEIGRPVVLAQAGATSIALRLACRRPGRLAAIVSLEGGAAEAAVTPGVRRAVRWAPLLKLVGGNRVVRGRMRKTLVERSADPAWVTPEVIEGYLRSAAADFDALIASVRRMARAREPEALASHLGEIRDPMHLMIGAVPHPGNVPPAELALMRALLPSFTVESVAGAGHFLAEEAPDAVIAAVARASGTEEVASAGAADVGQHADTGP